MSREHGKILNIPGGIWGWDGSQWRPAYIDSDGNLRVISNLDFTADIEVTGTPVVNRRLTASASGDNTLISVPTGSYLKLYKAFLSVSASITGEVILKIGTTSIAGIHNPADGGLYTLLSTFPDFEQGGDGEDLVINLPSATSVTINVSYEVV